MPKVVGVKDGSIAASEGLEKKGKRHVRKAELSLVYQVLADSLEDSEDDIRDATGIPPLFYPYRGYLCKSRDANEVNRVIHPLTGVPSALWEVTVVFSTDVNPEDEQPPTSLPPTVRWHGETEEEILEKDAITGDPVTTVPGEPIELTYPIVIPVLEITRYESYPFDPDVILDYSNRVNSQPFWGAPAGSALMLPMEVGEETIEGDRFAVVTYRIKFKIRPNVSDPWKARPLHYGTKYIEGEGSAAVVKLNEDAYGRVIPTNLSASGAKLADDAEPHYLEFNRFDEIDFNQLSLGPF